MRVSFLIEGNPLGDISRLTDPDSNINLIMIGGTTYPLPTPGKKAFRTLTIENWTLKFFVAPFNTSGGIERSQPVH
jgi:hypothetical protein